LYLPLDVQSFFSKVRAVSIDNAVVMSVTVHATGELGRSTDQL
jgi:hypothetical protein